MPASATVPDSRAQDWSHAFQALVDGIQLPSRGVKNFAGNPLDYHRFIIDFDGNISSCVKDPMTKLGKLMRQYSRPSLFVHQEKAFQTTKKIPVEQFGKQYKVVAAHMKTLKDVPRIREGDANSLYKLAT